MTKTVNKEAFRMLALEIGLNQAARKLDVPIPTAKSWARRGKWALPARKSGRPPKTLAASESTLHPIADTLANSHKELEQRTRTGLATATAKGAECMAGLEPMLVMGNSARLRDLASAAARVFGWDTRQPGVQFNQLVVTQEQLEQIRALRAS